MKKNNPVVVCGSLCNTDIATSELLSRYSFDVSLLRYDYQKIKDKKLYQDKLKYFSLEKIIYVKNRREASHILKNASLIVSLTGSISSFIKTRDFIFNFFSIFPKTVNITTGADITELVRERTPQGKKFLNLLNRSRFNFFNPYPEVIKTLQIKKIKNFTITKSPYYLLDKKKREKTSLPTSEYITFFHVSNLDWGVTDHSPDRNTTKGNDKFIRAFIRSIDAGKKIRCKMLLRGPDQQVAQDMINKGGCSEFFEFLPQVEQGALLEIIQDSDIVVDQFDVGALGGIACESMALEKPVMTYVDENCWPLAFDEKPPIINCQTEEDIYQAILHYTDKNSLEILGKKAEVWIRKYHDVQTANFSHFILRIALAARADWPRKDLANAK